MCGAVFITEAQVGTWLQLPFQVNAPGLEITKVIQQQTQPDIRELPVTDPVERSLKSGEVHYYRIQLQTGTALQIQVQEKGVDVAVTLHRVDQNTSITQLQARDWGYGDERETLTFIAEKAAVYVVQINGTAQLEGASYRLIGHVHRSAATDQTRIRAESLLEEARVLGENGSKEATLAAIEKYEQALSLWHTLRDKYWQGYTYFSIGQSSQVVSKNAESLSAFRSALALFKEAGDAEGECKALAGLGMIFLNLGQYVEGRNQFTQLLPLAKKIGDKQAEAVALFGIGLVILTSDEPATALDYFNQGSSLLKRIDDKELESIIQGLYALAHTFLEQTEKALAYSDKALISASKADKQERVFLLFNAAVVHLYTRNDEKALVYFTEALLIARATGNTQIEATSLSGLMKVWDNLEQPRTAIFYGKQAINRYQDLRLSIRSLEKETQKSFFELVKEPYRFLADLLIAEGRILEAEQVLAMLKQDEVFNYLRRDSSEIDNLQQRADLRPEEREALKRYNEIADKITTLGTEFNKLQGVQSKGVKLTPDQEKLYAELSQQIEDASRAFQVLLRKLGEEFAKRPNTPGDLQENLALQSDLKEWGEGVVFLYTLTGEDRYRVILVTPETQVDGKSEVSALELNDKIQKFREAVQDPRVDTRVLGKELYDILIKPVEKHLEGAKTKTLLWSLDGNLRLLPLAALWDGTQYFGQKYQNVTVTLASRTRLGDAVAPNWRALGLGVSEAKQVREPNGTRELAFKSLPAVRAELSSIVQSEQSPNGILPGQSLLDAEFNEKALEAQLLRGYKVVHVASHFSLNPGDSTRSFLLLGDGNILTVDKIKNNPKLSFKGVELLTLSACQTAVVEKDSSGKEIEGFGYVAQQKGAKAILATLWSVADESTQLFMSEFYRLRKQNPQLTKAATLQVVQQKMIAGKLKPTKTTGVRRDTSEAEAPAPNYGHPYYWSPFILIGNWR
jgi:CHAT domain-containing protein